MSGYDVYGLKFPSHVRGNLTFFKVLECGCCHLGSSRLHIHQIGLTSPAVLQLASCNLDKWSSTTIDFALGRMGKTSRELDFASILKV